MECELDRTYVSAVEHGRWNVSLSNIERLAKVFGVPAFALLLTPEKLGELPEVEQRH